MINLSNSDEFHMPFRRRLTTVLFARSIFQTPTSSTCLLDSTGWALVSVAMLLSNSDEFHMPFRLFPF